MRVESPLVNINVFKNNRVFVFSNIATLINYGATFADPVFLAQMQTTDGTDPSAVRGTVVGTSSSEFFIEEEQSFDAEVIHAPETVGFLALGAGCDDRENWNLIDGAHDLLTRDFGRL